MMTCARLPLASTTLVATLLALAAWTGSATAQATSVDAMVAALTPPPGEAPTRGIKRDNTGTVLEGLPTTELVVGFEGNTHILTLDGMRALRALAAVLNEPDFAGERFQIAGYSYLANDPVSSQPVSARRAQMVADHLVGFYGVDPARLVAVGLGATKLHDAANPADPLNQRIEVTNLGPTG